MRRPIRPTTSTGPTPPRRWRSSRGSPSTRRVALDDVSFEGITEIRPDDIAYARELGLSLKLLGVAERHGEAISVRVFPCFLYRGHPLAPVEGPFNAVTLEGADDQRDHDLGPRRGRDRDGLGRPRRRRLDPRRRGSGARRRAPARDPRRPRVLASTSTSRSPTSPACWPRSPTCSAATGSRSRASSSAARGGEARLVMVTHRAAETRFLRGARVDLRARLPRRAAARDPGRSRRSTS